MLRKVVKRKAQEEEEEEAGFRLQKPCNIRLWLLLSAVAIVFAILCNRQRSAANEACELIFTTAIYRRFLCYRDWSALGQSHETNQKK
jgi:hypothetical protein